MKLSIQQDPFSAHVQLAARALSTRSAMPALGGILLTARTDEVELAATDMEVSLVLTVPGANVEQEGSVLLPGRLLGDVVRSLPEGEVKIAQRPEQRDVEIAAGSATFHLRTLPAEDFPRLPSLDGDALSLPGAALSETVERVARAASRDEVRPILTGILLSASGESLTMVATDSYRLSVKHTPLEAAVAAELEANVPARALRELARVVAQEGVEQVEIARPANQIVFRAGDVVLASRLIDGQFPNYRQLVPESFEHEVRLPRDELLEACRRISQLAQRNAPLKLAFSEGELRISAETPDVGDAAESMPAPYSGEELEIAFNPQYLIEGVDSIPTDELVFQLTSPLRPGLLRPAGEDDYSYLVMPIRLNV